MSVRVVLRLLSESEDEETHDETGGSYEGGQPGDGRGRGKGYGGWIGERQFPGIRWVGPLESLV
jgi:hypothetical protein